jgi:hypothetical protein
MTEGDYTLVVKVDDVNPATIGDKVSFNVKKLFVESITPKVLNVKQLTT